MIVYAFHDSPIIAWPLRLGTLHWFGALAHDRGMLEAALASVKLALLAVVIALVVGVPGRVRARPARLSRQDRVPPAGAAAAHPARDHHRRRAAHLLQLRRASLSSGFPLVPGWPVVLGHAAALTSVVITQVFARLQRLDRAQEEASQDLYANEWQTFWYVTFPSIRTAVLGAGLLVFTLSLDEIAVTFFLIGRQNTLPLQIWGLLRRGITPEVNAVSTIIFVSRWR